MKKALAYIAVLVLAGMLAECNFSKERTGSKGSYNILLITADDLNYNSVGAYGCLLPGITPNIDKLAAEGILFTHAFVNISVCQPCRQSLMTGRYPHNNGAPGFDPIDRDVPTLQEQLQKAGYLNGIIGKEKHLMPMEKFCWDYCIKEGELASGAGIGRNPELYYQYTAELLSKAKIEGKPFFLMANSHDPHRPFAGSNDEKYSWGEDPPKIRRKILPGEVEVPGFLFDLPEVRLEIAEYYTSVYRCDETVGAILKALDESGLSENTLVMFISDNGMAVPFAKANCYLNSNKTPWIIRWPGIIPEESIDSTHFISGIDYMPTILDVLNLPQNPGMDGRSFLPILLGEKQEDRNLVFTQFHKTFAGHEYPMRSVQDKNYGYIANFWSDGSYKFKGDANNGRTYPAMDNAAEMDTAIANRMQLYKYRVSEELYDFRNDPDGLENLINVPYLEGEKQRLKNLLLKEMNRTQDPIIEEFEEKFMK